MRYLALATDYDNTIATEGAVPAAVVAGLRQLRGSGRKLILVTGRELPDLLRVFPHIELFDRVVAENGALLYRPDDRSQTLLSEPFPPKFLHALRERGVPVSAGQSIIATVQPHETTVLECIRQFGLELQVIFNREAVMILPSGVNKASGLNVALRELQLSSHNLVAVGDGENDHAFIDVCECAVAVANAIPSLREQADFVTTDVAGAGVMQVIEALLRDDFVAADARLTRHRIELGRTAEGRALHLPAYGCNVLIAGTSGAGKSTFASGLLERIAARGYRYCIVDPEGDYDHFEGAVAIGSPKQPPVIEDVAMRLEDPATNASVNLLGIPLEDRPAFFRDLYAALRALQTRLGRPHWLLLDEAHHLLSKTALAAERLQGTALVTVHPDRLPPEVLRQMHVLIAIGPEPSATIELFAATAGLTPPRSPTQPVEAGFAVAWLRGERDELVAFAYDPPASERKRHQRKYAHGDLGLAASFYFRGPDGKLNLRAQNLQLFMQMADGVDDATWSHHLQRGDYSHWFREFIKDEELAAAMRLIEQDAALSPLESRRRMRAEIEQRYTAPA